MSYIFNFSEIEEFDEFKFHLIEWNVDKILDSFKRYCSSSCYSSVDYENQNEGYLSLDMRSNLVGSDEMRFRDKSLAIIENDKLTDEQNVLELDSNKNEDLNSLDWAENWVVGKKLNNSFHQKIVSYLNSHQKKVTFKDDLLVAYSEP